MFVTKIALSKPKFCQSNVFSFFLSFFKNLFIYLRERVHAREGEGAEEEGQADSPLSMGLNAGLDPRTPRSQPEPKSDA